MMSEEEKLAGPSAGKQEKEPEGSGDSEATEQSPDGRPASFETGVSWIYKLRKEELNQELQKFRLDLTGTVEDKRRRLILFMRQGLSSPQPSRGFPPFVLPPPPPPVPQPRPTAATVTVTVPSSTPMDPLSMHKWNIHFNGKGDPAAFLERLDEICTYGNYNHDQLLSVLPELLQGTPLLWYRNNKRFWRTWTEFVRDFRTLYFPVNYLEDLEAETGRRIQRADESVVTYLTDLQTLIRRHGGMTHEQELRWLYRNLLPDYRQYIRRADFIDVPTLTTHVKEFEVLRKEVRQVYPPRMEHNPSTVAKSVSWGSKPGAPQQKAALPPSTAQTRPQQTPARQPPPSSSRTSPGPSNRPTSSGPDHRPVCWRCGETGHYRSQCRSPPKLFCSRCGRAGTMTRDCNCQRAEN